MTALLAGLVAAASLPAPASQHIPFREADYRVGTVAYRIASKAGALCGTSGPLSGILLHHLGEYPAASRPKASTLYTLDKGPGIMGVVAGSPAAAAGLQPGDVLLSANGEAFASPAAAASEPRQPKRRRLMEASEAQLEEKLSSGPVRLKILRDGAPLEFVLTPQPGCPARARLARSNQPNAFADGRYAIVTTKLLDFIRSDDELAIVLAHEMAHNILGHPARLEAEKVPGGILRHFGKNAARVLATEEEADRLGIKLVWAAGYDVSAAIPFWRRLYARYDPIPTPKLFRTHPGLGARERLIQQTIAEFQASGSQPGAQGPKLGEGALRQR
jgi:hypothetical protein